MSTKHWMSAVLALAAIGAAIVGCSKGPEPRRGGGGAKVNLNIGDAAKGGGGTEAAEQKATGWATLKGHFIIDGAAPARHELKIDKNPEICSPSGQPTRPDNDLLVDSSGGIANVGIYIRTKLPPDQVNEGAKGKSDEVIFDQKQCMFLTRLLPFEVTESVLVKNSDPIGHNTHIAELGDFNPNLEPGGSKALKATQPKAVPVLVNCNIHSWMSAYMLPLANGYFSVSKPDGSFDIDKLPAGIDLEFQVWHERATGMTAVQVDGKPETWKAGRFKLKLNPDETKTMEIKVPAATFGT